MNLAWRDIQYKFGRFILTCLGLSLLIAVVVTMAGIYRGLIADALSLARAIKSDLWVVEAGTHGPFAESSRIPGDTREMVARINGVPKPGPSRCRIFNWSGERATFGCRLSAMSRVGQAGPASSPQDARSRAATMS